MSKIIARKEQMKKKPSTSKSRTSAKSAEKFDVEVEKKEFELPALSLTYKPKSTVLTDFEKLRKKTIRRNAPPGEDLNHIKKIIKNTKGQNITVHEFISLIGPSTADQGETLRSVMQEDLNSFRKLARKVYDTITQDNSDVLLNQQIQLNEYYKERKALIHDKMMRLIEEIYVMAPKFCFDRYAAEKELYINELFPLPAEVTVEPEAYEMMKRQAAYHRLQWLRSEGERLNGENQSLRNRLNEMKKIHRQEQLKMAQVEKEAEKKRKALEEAEAEKTETLEMLNESLEQSIIKQEEHIRIKQDRNVKQPLTKKEEMAKSAKKKKKKRPEWSSEWNVEAARELEADALENSRLGESAPVTRGVRPRSPIPDTPTRQLTQRTAHTPRDTWGGFY